MKFMKIAMLLLFTAASLTGLSETASSELGLPFRDKRFYVHAESFSWRGQKVKFVDWLPIFSSKLGTSLRDAGLSNSAKECVLEARIVAKEDAVESYANTNSALRTSSPFLVISYKVLHSVTTRVKAKGEMSLDALAFSATDVKSFIEQTADAAASILSDNLVAELLPPEVTGRTAQGLLVVKARAQSALRAGEFLTVFARGEEVKDSAGKVVDWTEEAVGTVQLVRVGTDAVHALVVEGDTKRIAPGCRLRRVVIRK